MEYTEFVGQITKLYNEDRPMFEAVAAFYTALADGATYAEAEREAAKALRDYRKGGTA